MAPRVDLATNDSAKQLSLANIRLAGDRDYFVADLRVRSGGFSCDYPFYFDRFHAEETLSLLERMGHGEVAKAILKQEFEDDELRFSNDRLGHVEVSGEVIVPFPLHRFAFTIETDQTVLRPFIDTFREAIAEAR